MLLGGKRPTAPKTFRSKLSIRKCYILKGKLKILKNIFLGVSEGVPRKVILPKMSLAVN